MDDLGRWLTTVVARVCRTCCARAPRRGSLWGLPDPIIRNQDAPDPEQEALLADGVGLALQVVWRTLALAERPALVIHDTFAVPLRRSLPSGRSRPPPASCQPRPPPGRASTTVPDADLAHR